jgi:hypothetical protein
MTSKNGEREGPTGGVPSGGVVKTWRPGSDGVVTGGVTWPGVVTGGVTTGGVLVAGDNAEIVW